MAESEVELKEISASEILDKIQRGEPVEYDHVKITDYLDLNKLALSTIHVDRTEELKDFRRIELRKSYVVSEECKVVSASIRIKNSTFNKQVDFSNIFFKDKIVFEETTFKEPADFHGSIFSMYAAFRCATFSHYAGFRGVTFSGYACLVGATFSEVNFNDATFGAGAGFEYAKFRWIVGFSKATFSESVGFTGAKFVGAVDFGKATFSGSVGFSGATFWRSAGFNEATFRGEADFNGAKFAGDVLTFRDAVFKEPKSQEEACRRAKNIQAKAGNRYEEEYHFYRQMEAERKLHGLPICKPNLHKIFKVNGVICRLFKILTERTYSLKAENLSMVKNFLWYNIFEYVFIQKIFGYGVHPWWLMGYWGAIVIIFAVVYWIVGGMKGNLFGIFDYIEVSFATAIAPGYIAAIINSTAYTPLYHKIAILETIIGTFLWAGFIATFAKRYMR